MEQETLQKRTPCCLRVGERLGWAKEGFSLWRASPQGAECPPSRDGLGVRWVLSRPEEVTNTQASLAGPLSPSLQLGGMLDMGKWIVENGFSAQEPPFL